MRKTAQVTAINVINGMNSEQVRKVMVAGKCSEEIALHSCHIIMNERHLCNNKISNKKTRLNHFQNGLDMNIEHWTCGKFYKKKSENGWKKCGKVHLLLWSFVWSCRFLHWQCMMASSHLECWNEKFWSDFFLFLCSMFLSFNKRRTYILCSRFHVPEWWLSFTFLHTHNADYASLNQRLGCRNPEKRRKTNESNRCTRGVEQL